MLRRMATSRLLLSLLGASVSMLAGCSNTDPSSAQHLGTQEIPRFPTQGADETSPASTPKDSTEPGPSQAPATTQAPGIPSSTAATPTRVTEVSTPGSATGATHTKATDPASSRSETTGSASGQDSKRSSRDASSSAETSSRGSTTEDKSSSTQSSIPSSSAGDSSSTARSTAASTASSQTSPSSSTRSEDDSSSAPLVRVQAPYVDAAYIKLLRYDDGEVRESFKWESPRGEHQYVKVGNIRMADFLGRAGNISRTSYVVFDVSKIRNAQRAQIRFYLFASSKKLGGYGGYESLDNEEFAEIRSVDRFTPQALIDAPFNQKQDHSLDLPLFEDLADGKLYARRRFHAAELHPEHLEPAPGATGERRDCTDEKNRACGRWVTFTLTQEALEDINQSKGLWATGWSLGSITHANRELGADKGGNGPFREWLFTGGYIDLNILPDFKAPAPQLIIEEPERQAPASSR